MSLLSQRSELERVFGDRDDVRILEVLAEAKSAKTPGRPVFGDMLRRIEAGEADGIIAWAPDRLARNSIDGGRIIYLLDTGTIRDLKFATYTFENNSQGKFMLQIMFGQSKYYSDALSENVKRGNRTRVQQGWRPNVAPLGYLNDKETRTILPDPHRFGLVRQLFELAMAGAYSPRQLVIYAEQQLALTTPIRKKRGGGPLKLSAIYKLLRNPFYAGQIVWGGQVFPGKHQPMLTLAEFDLIQQRLRRQGQPQPSKNEFLYAGLLRCSCGRRITAEAKINRYGRRYVYYHCTRTSALDRCFEPAVNERDLNAQVIEFLSTLTVAAEMEQWIEEAAKGAYSDHAARERDRLTSIDRSLTELSTQLDELTAIRLRRLLTDEEFAREKRQLEDRRARLLEQKAEEPIDFIELSQTGKSICKYAPVWFSAANISARREFLRTVAIELFLSGKKLFVQAAFPFALGAAGAHFYPLWAAESTERILSISSSRPQLRVRASEVRKLVELMETGRSLEDDHQKAAA